MRAIPTSIVSIFLGIASSAALATENHIGLWEHWDGTTFFRLELKRDGSCFMVAGGKEDGIGGECKYTFSASNIDIIEFEENGKMNAVPNEHILRFRYEAASDSISFVSPASKIPRKLSRTTKKRYAD